LDLIILFYTSLPFSAQFWAIADYCIQKFSSVSLIHRDYTLGLFEPAWLWPVEKVCCLRNHVIKVTLQQN